MFQKFITALHKGPHRQHLYTITQPCSQAPHKQNKRQGSVGTRLQMKKLKYMYNVMYPSTVISVLYFHDNDLILSEVQHIVVSLQRLQFAVLILSIESSDVFPRAAPLPRAPDYQRVVEVIVVRYLDGLWLWCVCVYVCVCVCVRERE